MSEIKKVSYVPWLGTPKKNKVFAKDIGNWEYCLKNSLAKKKIIIGTDDVVKVEEADAAIIFDNLFYKNLNVFWKLYHAHILHKSIYIDYEPPTGHCRNHSPEGLRRLSKIFKKVITYNDDVVDGNKIVKGNIANFYSKELPYKHDFHQRKFITMVTNNTSVDQIISILNNCNNSNYYNRHNLKKHRKQLYSKRKQAARYFMKKCPNEFDLYGNLWPNDFQSVLKGSVNKTDKCDLLSQYKFIISYDSFKKQDGYISEKIFDAFRAKTIPIYWGADNIEKYIPKECYIDKRNFRTYKKLYHYLRNMTEEEYEYRIGAIERYLQSDLYKKYFSSEASARVIEDALLCEDNDFSYEEAYEQLMYYQKKKDEVDRRKKINFYISQILKHGTQIEIVFNIVDYSCLENIDYQIFANGKVIQKKQYKITKISEEQIEYDFKVMISWDNYPVKVTAMYYCNDEMKQLELVDLNKNLSKYFGANISKDYQTLTYYNYFGLPKIKKLEYMLKYDRKRILDLIKLQFCDKCYRLKKKYRRLKVQYSEKLRNNPIMYKGVTVLVRFIRLPILYIKDIINVFR